MGSEMDSNRWEGLTLELQRWLIFQHRTITRMAILYGISERQATSLWLGILSGELDPALVGNPEQNNGK
jgi:hypothetical protein